ncbi:MAG: pilus assembly protein PilN [Gammaproteobacteria bacterium]|nr:pilus assembly protein PilN [Gammaproteobacteria bacterium]
MPNINLLPWREQRRMQRQQNFIIAVVAGAATAAALAFMVHLFFKTQIDHQQKRNDYMTAQIEILDKQIEEIRDLERLKERQLARMDIIEQLQRSRPEVVHLFDELVRQMPDGVYLTAVKQNGRLITIDGIAQSSTYVSAFMRNINRSKWLKDPRLSVVQTIDTSKVKKRSSGPLRGSRFSVTAQQTAPYLEQLDQFLDGGAA